MNRGALWLWLQLAWRHYGPVAFCAVVLALVEVVGAVTLLQGARGELAGLQDSLAGANTRLSAKVANAAESRPSANVTLEQFESVLVNGADVPAALTANWTAAGESRVFASTAEYRFEPDVQGGFTRMRIILPVVGSYPAIKHYAFAQLRTNPAMALKKLTIKRERVNTGDVSAELHFVLLLKGNIK